MALGGGTWITQNKVLPGSYINVISADRAGVNLSDRGYVALPMELDWCKDEEVFTVTQEDFQKDSLKIFGYSYDSDKMKGLRDLFKNATVLYAYKLNKGVKASNDYATAKYSGTRGNDLKIVIAANVDESNKFDVTTYLGTTEIETQTSIARAADLVNNEFVDFKSDAELTITAGISLTGGTNGNDVTGTEHQAFLNKIESYNYNTLGCLSTDDKVKSLYVAFVKRMRDEVGAKIQLVGYKIANGDYEGVITVDNKVTDEGELESSLVYWVLGIEGGCAVNKSNTNKKYNGEFTINIEYTQTQLKNCIREGKLVLHKVGDDIKVLTDINSLITYTKEKGQDFSSNQVMRVVDQIAIDDAILFNTKYLGEFPNDASGRISLWNDLCDIDKKLQNLRAIENFNTEDVTVEKGETKKSVVVNQKVTPVVAMEQMYMTTVVA